MCPFDTLAQTVAHRFQQDRHQAALHVKRDTTYHVLTWEAIARDVRRVARLLRDLSAGPGDRIAHLSENRYEWIVADLAMHIAQLVHVPIHAPLAPAQVLYQIRHSEAKIVLVSDQTQLAKLAAVEDQLPSDLQVISYETTACTIRGCPVPSLFDLLDQRSVEPDEDLERQAACDQKPDSLVTILYTSGTTGEPKGVMLSHGNLVSNTLATLEIFGTRAGDVRLNFLPLSHIFARTCDLYTWLASGSQLALAQSRDTVLDDCAQTAPHYLNGVPYFFDRLCRVLRERGEEGRPGSLRELLGGRIVHCCSGGAALPDHLFDFFQRQKVPLLQGYGLTESSPVISVSAPGHVRRGSSGRPITGVLVRIAEDGEILTRGPHVMMGYWLDEQATRQAIRDGWLYTGDLGRLDEDGFLYITGRKKEILVTAAGKNIAPVYLEGLLTEDPLIDQVMVIGDGRNYLTALVVPNRDRLLEEMENAQPGLACACSDVLDHPMAIQWVQQRIHDRLACVSHHEQVRRCCLLSQPFSIERGELTAKLSLRRAVIEEHYREQIEAMYRRGDTTKGTV